MAADIEPIIHNWYRELERDQKFTVVALDDVNNLVEIQQIDGNIEEMTLEDWRQLELEPIEVPEDWTGPIDEFHEDDLGYTETAMSVDEWNGANDELSGEEAPATVYHWDEDIDEIRGA